MADVFFTVGVEEDQASVDQAAASAGAAYGKKFTQASKKAVGSADEIFKDIQSTVKRIAGLQANALKTGVDVRQFAPLERGLERLLTLQRQFAADRARLAKDPAFVNLLRREADAVQALTSSQTRELQSTVAAINVQERAKAHAADRAAALTNIQAQRDAQLQINAARTAGKARIVLAQQIGAQLLSAERIISNGITNIIRGTAKAVGKVWDSTVGSLRRTFSERRTIVEGGLKNESRLFSQSTIISQRANQGILGAIGNNLGTIGGGFALGAAARQIFTLGSDFTRGLNVLQAQLQLTNDQMKGVSDQAIQLGNDIKLPGVSALDAAQAIGLLAKQFAALGAGALPAAQAAAKGTLQLARAVGAAPEEAAAAVGAAVNVFGENAANATKVADQLTAALSQAAGTSFTDFSQAFTQGAAVVSSFIVPADGATNAITEFSAALAVLARGGLVGSDAGTSIKQFFLQANRGTDEVNTALAEVSARAGETGTAFFDASGKARPLVQTIDILQRGLVGLTEEQRAQTLQTIFGSDATRVANILIGQGAAALLTAEAAVQRQGAAADLAAAQNKGLAGAIDAIKSQFETFAILIFQKVNPVLGEIGLGIADFIDKLANGEGAFATVRKGLLGVAAALGAVVAVKGISEVVGLIGSIASLLGPFGLAIAGIGAVIGIATGGFRNFGGTLDRLKEILQTVTKAISFGLGKAIAFLRDQFKRIQPIIQPVLDRLGTFAKRIIDIGRSFQQAFKFGGLSNAFQNLRKNLGSLGQDILTFLAPIGRRLGEALVPVRDLALGIRDRLVAAFRAVDFGAIVGIIGTGIKKATSTSLGQAITGGGIGAVAGGLIAGPLGVAIGAALGVAIAKAIPRLKEAIGRINVADLFGAFLKKVNDLGRLIGQILSSRQFLVGVAGVAAGAAAIGVQFVTGFVSGVLSHLGDIAAAGATILNALFAQNSVVKAVVALAILLRKQIFGVFTSNQVGKEGGQVVAKNVAEGVSQDLPKTLGARLKTLGGSTVAAFKDLGSKAAQGLSVALSAGLSGSALGGAQNNLEKGLGLAGLAGSIAAGAAVGGAPGAVAAAGIGLLTTAISANATEAAKARDVMLGYKDAIQQTGDVSAGAAQQITGQLEGASTRVREDLAKTTFSVEGLAKAIEQGRTKEFLADISKQLIDILPKGEVAKTRNRIQDVMGFLDTQTKQAQKSLKEIKLDEALNPKGGGGIGTGFRDGIQGIIDKVKEAVRQKRELAADVRAEQLQTKLRIIKEGTEAIGKAADVSKQKILELAQGPQAKTPEQGGAEATQGVINIAPDVSQAFLTGLDTALGSAQLTNALASLSTPLSAAVQDGLGNAFTPEQIATNLGQIKAAINQAVQPDGTAVPDAVKQKLLEGVAAFEAVNVPLIIEEQAVADLRTAAAAGDAMADAALASKGLSSGISVKSKADLAAAVTAGGDIVNSADSLVQNFPVKVPSKAIEEQAVSAGKTIHSTAQKAADKPIKVGSTVTPGTGGNAAGNAIARSVLDGFASGMASGSRAINKTVTSVFAGVTATAQATFRIHSPSRVFMGIGEEVIKGLALGLTNTTEEAVSAAEDVAKAVIEATRNTATRLAAAGAAATGGIFSGVFESAAVQARISGFEASIQITRALEGIADTVNAEAVKLWNAAAKPAQERTLEDMRIIARSDFASAFNLENQEAIKTAVDAIKGIGQSLVEQGQGAQAAANAMIAYRGALIQAAAAAGLNAAAVSGIVDQLGLSNAALDEFVRLSNQAGAIVGASPGFIPAAPPPLVPGPNAAQTFILNNEFATPFDDPEAVSLAVVNRLAQSVRR